MNCPPTDAAQQLGSAEAAFNQLLNRGLLALQAWGRLTAEVRASLSGTAEISWINH